MAAKKIAIGECTHGADYFEEQWPAIERFVRPKKLIGLELPLEEGEKLLKFARTLEARAARMAREMMDSGQVTDNVKAFELARTDVMQRAQAYYRRYGHQQDRQISGFWTLAIWRLTAAGKAVTFIDPKRIESRYRKRFKWDEVNRKMAEQVVGRRNVSMVRLAMHWNVDAILVGAAHGEGIATLLRTQGYDVKRVPLRPPRTHDAWVRTGHIEHMRQRKAKQQWPYDRRRKGKARMLRILQAKRPKG